MSGGKKESQTVLKPDYSLIPKVALDAMALAFMEGEKKYDRWNYEKGFKISELSGAAGRHLAKYNDGEDLEPDFKEIQFHHLGAVLATCAMLLRCDELGTLIDDRSKAKRLKGLKNGSSTLPASTL